ncbi:Holliday junction branch migration protein RuvA [bacterium]|nr:Holliday junction branch migration protein RuvA [bacterium]
MVSKLPTAAVLETGGIGYSICIPLSTYGVLPDEGEETHLHTHFVVREDKVELFGFATPEERSLFRKLISVNRVGGNLAINVLSQLGVGDFVTIVETNDVKMLTNVSGIGKKSAERIILELKNKLDDIPIEKKDEARDVGLKQEGINALVSLGYTRAQAFSTVEGVLKIKKIDNLEHLLRESFKLLRRD